MHWPGHNIRISSGIKISFIFPKALSLSLGIVSLGISILGYNPRINPGIKDKKDILCIPISWDTSIRDILVSCPKYMRYETQSN